MQERSGFSGFDLCAALIVITIWGFNFVAMKYALREFTPFQLGFWRYVFAVLPLLFFVRRPALSWCWLVAAGLTQFGQFGFLFVALKVGMSAALASVVMQTQVFITAVFGLVFLRERLSVGSVAGLLLAALGLACLSTQATHGSANGGLTTLGLLLNLIGAAMWAISNVVTRRIQGLHPDFDALQFIIWMSLIPILPFAALAWWGEPQATRWQWLDASISAWASVAYLGWLATVAAYALWTRLLKRHQAGRVAPFSLGVPALGLAAGHLLLGEVIAPMQALGAALVVLALVVSMTVNQFFKPAADVPGR